MPKKSRNYQSFHQNFRQKVEDNLPLSGALAMVLLFVMAGGSQTYAQSHFRFDLPNADVFWDATFDDNASVLGDSDESEEEDEKEVEVEDEQEREEEEKREEEESKRREEEARQAKKLQEANRQKGETSRQKTRTTETREGKKYEFESESADGKKLKIKQEADGRTRIDVEHAGDKVRFQVRDGVLQTEIREEDESEEELEVETETEREATARLKREQVIQQRVRTVLEEKGIQVATAGGRPAYVRNKVAASSAFPLTINPETNELIVTTNAGTKTVTVLPDQAVNNLLEKGIFASVERAPVAVTNEDGSTDFVETSVDLQVTDDEPVYTVRGRRKHRILGLIPVETEGQAVVSAETGEVLTTQQSFLSNLVDLISF